MTAPNARVAGAPRPTFVVVEGLDGVGKSTTTRLLAEALDAVHLATPDEELTGARQVLEPLLDDHADARMLWYAAAVMRVSDRVGACRAAGRAVVVDRYFLSTVAYAELRGARLRLGEVAGLLAVPDVTIYLHAAHATRAERLRGRDGNSREDMRTLDAAVDARLDAAFRRGSSLPVAARFVPVDTTGRSPADVVAAVIAELAPLRSTAAHARTLRALPPSRAPSAMSVRRPGR